MPHYKQVVPAEGKSYWYHSVTRETSWEMPAGGLTLEQALALPELPAKPKAASSPVTPSEQTEAAAVGPAADAGPVAGAGSTMPAAGVSVDVTDLASKVTPLPENMDVKPDQAGTDPGNAQPGALTESSMAEAAIAADGGGKDAAAPASAAATPVRDEQPAASSVEKPASQSGAAANPGAGAEATTEKRRKLVEGVKLLMDKQNELERERRHLAATFPARHWTPSALSVIDWHVANLE